MPDRDKCIRCKKNEPEPGKTNCTDCAEYKSLYSAGRRDIRKVMGKCGVCGEKLGPADLTDCRKCRDRANENARLRTKTRREERLAAWRKKR